MDLLDDESLERSDVVANSRMNRERTATGVNSYEKDVGINPISFLSDRLDVAPAASWLDLCCGLGRALIATALALRDRDDAARVIIHGIDLVDMFEEVPSDIDCIQLISTSLHRWKPDRAYDLITCVHGLHYVGDKLSLLQCAPTWLTNDGRFQANLDLDNLRSTDGKSLRQQISRRFRESGLSYDGRKHIVSCVGCRSVSFGYRYVGADDEAGPNYSGQEAVDSYYEPVNERTG